ncbi:MAG: ATPase, T2SS/T4P/T4SS family, partial [Acidobacteriota bacterium]|nr:ATPase, T2SS/T4P/T4SS family [Acidobacteriota bacterium]
MAPASHDRGADVEDGVDTQAPHEKGTDTDRLDELLRLMASRGATDLHLKPMRPPLIRVHGKLVPTSGAAFAPQELERLIHAILPGAQRDQLASRERAEFGYSVAGLSRFRVAVYYQRGTLVATFRSLPYELPGFEELGLPDALLRICGLTKGVVLVAGPSGSGKSTTLAALVREIVDKRLVHVMTIEAPIEHQLRDGMGSVIQQEIGSDTPGFAEGIDNALAEDCDVIVVDGDVDPFLMSPLLDAAHADRLVLVSFKADSVSQAIESWIAQIPAQWQRKTLVELAGVLQLAMGLKLVERCGAQGVVPALELLWRSPRMAELIASGRHAELEQEMRSGPGMQSLDDSLAALVAEGTIDPEEALKASRWPEQLEASIAPFQPVAFEAPPMESDQADVLVQAEPSRLQELLELDEKHERLKSRFDQLSEERNRRVEDLEGELCEQQRRSAELSKQLEQLNLEKEQILQAVEREARRFEQEERH